MWEILGDDLKLERLDESRDKKRREEKEKMYQLVGLGKARSEQAQNLSGKSGKNFDETTRVKDPAESVELQRFGHILPKCEEFVSPRLCRMEGVDVLVEREQKSSKRAQKRETIPVQVISRLCNCFMVRTSLAETRPRRREIKSTKQTVHVTATNNSAEKDSCRRKKRTEVGKVNLFCHGERLREEKANVDQRRAAEERERIQHQRKKLIEPYLHMYRSKISKGGLQKPAPLEESSCMVAKHLKDVVDIFRQQQLQTAGSRSRSSDSSDENKACTPAAKSASNLTRSSASVGSGLRQTPNSNSLKKNIQDNCREKTEEKKRKDTAAAATRNSEESNAFTEKRQQLFPTEPGKDLAVACTTSQLQRSTSLKDHFEAERKAEVASQAKKVAKDLDVFQEIEGESPHHRKLRYEGFKYLQSYRRAVRKIEAIHQQEEARQRERDEKTKAAYELDPQIQRWSCGKEENLRALLSTLQNVLWPECEWKVVPSAELVTPSSVKKVYRRASFCLHPDKVQQKGGTVEQKYVAEKVFGVLREAWNKFYNEELV